MRFVNAGLIFLVSTYGVVGQRDRMEHRRLHAGLPVLGKRDRGFLRFGGHRRLRQRVLQSFRLENTIRIMDSACYGPRVEPQDPLDQDSDQKGAYLAYIFRERRMIRLMCVRRCLEDGSKKSAGTYSLGIRISRTPSFTAVVSLLASAS